MSKEQNVASLQKECKCYLCINKEKVAGKKRVPWTIVCKYILKALANINEKQYYSAHDDIYPFVVQHWDILGELTQFKNGKSWKKALLDAMNHSDQFESGTAKKRIGLWKLKSPSGSIETKESSDREKKPKKLKHTSIRKNGFDIFQFAQLKENDVLKPTPIKEEKEPIVNNQITPNNPPLIPVILQNDLEPLYEEMYYYVFKSIRILNKRRKQMKNQFNSTQRILALIAKLKFDLKEEGCPPSSFVSLRIL